MKVISNENEELDSEVSIGEIDGHYGLIIESRGGKKNTKSARNSDYNLALKLIIERLQKCGVSSIRVFLVSRVAIRVWPMKERALLVDSSDEIRIKYKDPETLRKQLGKAMSEKKEKKENHSNPGGCTLKRILIDVGIEGFNWRTVVSPKCQIRTASEDEMNFSEESFNPNNIDEAKDKNWQTTVSSKYQIWTVSEDEINSSEETFNPDNIDETKEKITKTIANRRGLSTFREILLKAYNEKCAITGTSVTSILEAAHILPYQGEKTNHISNGLLLRSDIHTLFDLGLISIDGSYNVVISQSLADTEYSSYNGKKILLPKSIFEYPSREALALKLSNTKFAPM